MGGCARSPENAVVLLAVEGGSRAWGCPSPDSAYTRPRDAPLALYRPRDVIEFPLEGG
jgi:predicted nucleotidyltransferase